MNTPALLVFLVLLAIAAFMAYERTFKSAAFLFVIAVGAAAVSLLPDDAPPSRAVAAAATPQLAVPVEKRPPDPGPTKFVEIAFEAGAGLCSDRSECLARAFALAFESECRSAIAGWIKTDYRLHSDEAIFAWVTRGSPAEFTAEGISLFVQDEKGAYRRRRWQCIVTRLYPDGSRRSDYLVYAVPPL
jgi:hypothetical protein